MNLKQARELGYNSPGDAFRAAKRAARRLRKDGELPGSHLQQKTSLLIPRRKEDAARNRLLPGLGR